MNLIKPLVIDRMPNGVGAGPEVAPALTQLGYSPTILTGFLNPMGSAPVVLTEDGAVLVERYDTEAGSRVSVVKSVGLLSTHEVHLPGIK